jgi:hypothetical protein
VCRVLWCDSLFDSSCQEEILLQNGRNVDELGDNTEPQRSVVGSLAIDKHLISPIGVFVIVMLGFQLLVHFCPLPYYGVSISE